MPQQRSHRMFSIIVAFYNVYPPVSGAASVSYNTAKFMRGTRLLFHIDNDPTEQNFGKGFRAKAFACRSGSHFTKILGLLRLMPQMAKVIRRLTPDIIILEGASWAVYYWLFLRLLKLFKVESQIAYHAHNVEYLLRKQRNNRFIALLTRWAEGAVFRSCPICTAVSFKDAPHIEQLYGVKPVLLPNGIDPGTFDRVTNSEIRTTKRKYRLGKQTVLFMGLTTFPPNKEAIRFLIQDVFPRLVRDNPHAKLAIIGGAVETRRPWLINPGIIPYEEVPAFIKACDACVAPVFSGSGTRLKILEYMAAGRPVVATPKGAEGLDCRDGHDFLLAEDAEGFAERIEAILSRPRFFQRMAEHGRRTVAQEYSWKKILATFQLKLAESIKR
jgi:glycosyltransferase involved in cell wall biosynthesis